MRILQITNRVPWPLNDGGNLATFNVTRHLSINGHDVVVAALNTRKHFVNPADFPDVARLHTVDIDTTLSRTGLLKGFFSKKPYNVMRFHDLTFQKMLIDLVTEESFDIIQMEGSYLAHYLAPLRMVTDTPFILRSHNIEHNIWGRLAKAEHNPLKRAYLNNLTPKIRRFELDTLHGYDGIVAITDEDAAWYRENGYKGELVTINAGVDLSHCKPSGRQPILDAVCFIGSLEWMPNQNGLRWFIRQVWEPLAAQFPDVRFHVAGKNPPQELRNLKVPGLKFYGMVPDAVQFMDSFGIMVTPLFSGSGMRLKVVEAMAMGKCIVSTRVGAEGIRYTHGKDIFIEDTPEAFQNRLAALLQDPELVRKTGEYAQATAIQYYDWRNLITQFENFYAQVRQKPRE